MTQSGMTDRLLNFCNALFGRFRGGLALSNVASATIMSGISGSAVADTSALGKVLIPSMIKSGYDRGFAAALTAAANVVGPIIPPSITFIMIINISSIAAVRYTGYPYPACYAGKAGVNHLTASIAMEYAAQGIRANAIMPGVMDTPHIHKNISGQYASHDEMVAKRNALCPMGRMGTGWDIARAAAFLASDDAQFITGVSLPVDGGYSCRS